LGAALREDSRMRTLALSRVFAAVGAVAAALGALDRATAQDVNTSARYGVASLTANFRPDPHIVTVQAGGGDSAASLGSGCAGYISNERADYKLNYTSGTYALGIYVMGDVDTTLVVNDPSGKWFCNDDFGGRGGSNPGLVFQNPKGGTYDIWVGSYAEDGTGKEVELVITETSAPWEPLFGTTELTANFSPDPHVVEIIAGGPDAAETLAPGCVGYLNAARPDYAVVYSGAGPYSLSMFAEGAQDSTLIIEDPNGRWYCNDDYSASSGHNPGIVLDDPVDGYYRIWVGTYAATDPNQSVNLIVTERGEAWGATAGASGGAPRGDGTQLVSSGTGFLVSSMGHVLTNDHVVDGCTRQTFQLRGELAVEAESLATNATADLALLKTTLTVVTPAHFRGGSNVRLGDEVVVYGFPLLGDLSSQGNLTNGIISALSGLDDDLSRMQMTAQIQPGNSGGPVMDRAGQIVGVVVETANDEYFRRERGAVAQNVNFAIRDSLARSFLDTNNVHYAVAPGKGPDMSIADIAEGAQKFTGTILCYR
jgi:S1-C subfamily serine protease